MTKKAQTITFGYSDSEDRLWARLIVNADQDVKFWITRRLLENFIEVLTDLLETETQKSTPNTISKKIQQQLKIECFEASRATWDPNPPPSHSSKRMDTKTSNIELCLKIDIQISNTWTFQFSGAAQKNISLILDRLSIPKFLIALLHQQKLANWQIPAKANWQ